MWSNTKRGQRLLRWVGQQIVYVAYLVIIVIFGLELCYRQYWVDFYGSNLRLLNPDLGEDDSRERLLVIGDSFSADRESYVTLLRDSLPQTQVVNAAIPGTCLAQHQLFIDKRVIDHQPTTFIYQLYVGNDFLEYRHPTNSNALSWPRRVYWWLSDRLRVLGYINAKLPAIRQKIWHDLPTHYDTKPDTAFTVDRYSTRVQLHVKAEPTYLSDVLRGVGRRGEETRHYCSALVEQFQVIPENCRKILLVLPHNAQLGEPYTGRYVQLRADTLGVVWQPSHSSALAKALTTALVAEDVLVLDPLPYFYDHPLKSDLYYPNDPHLTPVGQQILGEWMLEQIRQD